MQSRLDEERLKCLRPEIVSRLSNFKALPREKWPQELLFCLLTPQSSPYRAQACLDQLIADGILAGAPLTTGYIAGVLRAPHRYVRFHNVKARHVSLFIEQVPAIEEIIYAGLTPFDERERLVRVVRGFGWKEASHGLRNIGREGLSILDRHILKNLARLGVIDKVPNSLSEKKYKEIEGYFRLFASECGESMDVLDLFFWASETGTIFK